VVDEKKKPEPTSEVLSNPARVTRQQLPHIVFDVDERYAPIIQNSDVTSVCAIVVLKDRKPNEPEELVFQTAAAASSSGSAASAAAATPAAAAATTQPAAASGGPTNMDEDAAPPASFEFDENLE
jgi:hypothetical protein